MKEENAPVCPRGVRLCLIFGLRQEPVHVRVQIGKRLALNHSTDVVYRTAKVMRLLRIGKK